MPFQGPFYGYAPRDITGSDANSDPRSSKTIGYRSGAGRLPQPRQSYAGGTFQRVMYNDWWFPPTCSVKATFVPEYTTAGTALKYVTLAVTVEAIITPGDIGGPETVKNTDYTMDVLRQRLLAPQQEFHLIGNGFGNIIINDPDEPASQWDVDFGPKPQVLDWEPLAGGMACRVQWLCATRIPRCTLLYDDLTGEVEDIEDDLPHYVLETEWTADWNYGEDGFLVMEVSGKVQIPGTNISFVEDTDQTRRNVRNGYMYRLELVKNRLLKLFPQKEGFKRSIQYQLNSTASILNFTFTDTEIKSPQGYPEGAIKFDIQESLSSSVDRGFNTWDWRLNGEISVPKVLFKEELNPGTNVSMVNNKQLCYTAFYKVLMDRINRIKQIANQNKQDAPINLKTLEGGTETKPQKLLYFIPNKVSMSNEIFGNSLSIDLVYTIVCPSNLIIAASGMFDQVRVPGFTWPEWLEWLIAAKVLPDSVRGTLPERDYVVDICDDVKSTEDWNYEQAKEDGKITGNGVPEDYAVNGDKTYIEYTNKFEVETYHSVSFAAKLLSGTSPVGETAAILQNRKNAFTALSDFDFSENTTTAPEVSPKENPLLLSSSGNPVTIVRMIGRATRIGAPANPPKLISVDGQPAIRFGKDTVMTENKTMGGMLVDLDYPEQLAYNPETNPNIRSLYRTTWEKTYIINGVPSVAQLETTGMSEYYM